MSFLTRRPTPVDLAQPLSMSSQTKSRTSSYSRQNILSSLALYSDESGAHDAGTKKAEMLRESEMQGVTLDRD